MTAPVYAAELAGAALCEEASCESLWRVELADGSLWCRLHAAAAKKALHAAAADGLEVARRRPCGEGVGEGRTCGALDDVRFYPSGWRCGRHDPALRVAGRGPR